MHQAEHAVERGHLGNAYRLSGRIEEAIAAFKAYDARYPGFGITDLVIAWHDLEPGTRGGAADVTAMLAAAKRSVGASSPHRVPTARDDGNGFVIP